MWSRFVAVLAFVLHQVHIGYASSAIAHDPTSGVTYKGIVENDIEVFYGISYGLDTGGEHRFRPPRLAVAPTGSVVNATRRGPACPQQKGAQGFPLYLANITDISENCLSVNIYRHAGIFAGAKLPVMLFIHGGSFVYGSKEEPVIQPEGLIRQSVVLGSPVISVNINYRLGGECPRVLVSARADRSFSLRVRTIRSTQGRAFRERWPSGPAARDRVDSSKHRVLRR